MSVTFLKKGTALGTEQQSLLAELRAGGEGDGWGHGRRRFGGRGRF